MGAIITRSDASWWDLNRALSGEMMRGLMRRLCREDMFGQVRLRSSVALLGQRTVAAQGVFTPSSGCCVQLGQAVCHLHLLWWPQGAPK